jgi:hypothetical protein
MMSTILNAFARLWLAAVRRFPARLARQGRVNKAVRTRYSHDLCGDQPLPIRQKKPVSPLQPVNGQRTDHSSMIEGW